MEENKDMLELVKKIEAQNRRQGWFSLIRCGFALVCAVCCLVLVTKVSGYLPRLDGIISQMEGVLANLEVATDQIAKVDMQGMVSDVDALVATGQESLNQVMKKLEGIDFDTLNKAIEDLSDVIEPLAKFANSFRFR